MAFKKILGAALLATSMTFGVTLTAQATPVVPQSFGPGLNTGFSVGEASDVDGVDWFVFESDGVNAISFWFDRTVAAPDLIAGLYRGDTTGFDYVAAGAGGWFSYSSAAAYNSNLTYVTYYDDSHDDGLGGPFGDPHFTSLLSAGTYSLALSSLGSAGTYQFTTNATPSTAVPEPASLALFGAGLAGLGFARRRSAKTAA
ncbi:hypothetical protein JCM17960_30880 [Magnetospira thiophila]